MDSENYSIVDVETTGGSPGRGRIIEIGLLKVERGELVSQFSSLINPGTQVPEFISEFTGIRNDDVAAAPYFEEIGEDLLPLFEDSIFVAHNSSFDYRFLKSEFHRIGFGFSMDTLCTVRLSRALYPQHKRHNLSELIDRFKLTCRKRHRALDDAKVLWDFLQIIRSEFPPEKLASAISQTMARVPPSRQAAVGAHAAFELEYVPDSA